jgi:hypothetical protein
MRRKSIKSLLSQHGTFDFLRGDDFLNREEIFVKVFEVIY